MKDCQAIKQVEAASIFNRIVLQKKRGEDQSDSKSYKENIDEFCKTLNHLYSSSQE